MSNIRKLFYNGRFYTMEKEGATASAAVVHHGLFEMVGSLQDCLSFLKDEPYDKIDLEGNTVLPGFIDSHMHLIGHGEKLETVNLSSMRTKKEIQQRLHADSIKNDVIIAEGSPII